MGTLSHFVYDWSNKNTVLGYFFPVNESNWEHLKLIFFPTVIFSLIEYCFVKKEIKNYLFAFSVSVIIGILSIPVLFGTYTGILGYSVDFVNIAIYFISVIIMLFCKNKIIESEKFDGEFYKIASAVIIFGITILFIVFTYNPPEIALFVSPE